MLDNIRASHRHLFSSFSSVAIYFFFTTETLKHPLPTAPSCKCENLTRLLSVPNILVFAPQAYLRNIHSKASDVYTYVVSCGT